MNTIKCLALVAFTHFVAGFGMVHGDPDSDDDKAKNPNVPEDAVEYLVESGKIEAPDLAEHVSPFKMKHLKFGNYLITGPGVAPDTTVKGKKDAEAMIKALEEAYAAGEGAPADEGGAPV